MHYPTVFIATTEQVTTLNQPLVLTGEYRQLAKPHTQILIHMNLHSYGPEFETAYILPILNSAFSLMYIGAARCN